MGDALYSRLHVRCLVQLVFAVAFSLVGQGAAQQNITLRILDYKSAKPMAKLYLSIEGFNGDLSPGGSWTIVMRISTKTDRNGSVVVSVPEPPPEHMRVSSFDLFEGIADFSPADVLKSGTVMQYGHATEAQKAKVAARPGEVVVFNKRITAWDRMLQEIP
jgi:hypothetical protein